MLGFFLFRREDNFLSNDNSGFWGRNSLGQWKENERTLWLSLINKTFSMLDEFNFYKMCSILIICKNLNIVYLIASCELCSSILLYFKPPIAMNEIIKVS